MYPLPGVSKAGPSGVGFLLKFRQKLVGGAICYIVGRHERIFYIDSELLGRLKQYASKWGVSFLPALICGSLENNVLIDKKLDLRQQHLIMDLILRAITNEAMKHRLPICFRYLRDGDQDLMRLLKKKGFHHTPVIPYMYMDIKWDSFDTYVKSLTRNIKKSFSRERNRNKKEGVRIEIEKDPGKYEDRLFELINNHYLRYNGFPFFFKKEFIHKAQENIGQNCKFYISWKNEVITGVSFSLTKNKTLYKYATAVDRKLAGNDMTFFNIGYHRAMMDAISNGIKKIDNGMGMVEMKTRRGYKTGNQYFFYKASNKISNIAIKPWFIFLSKWYERKNAISFNK